MGKIMQDTCPIVDGRGGGRPQQAQGGGPATEKLDRALQSAYERICLLCKRPAQVNRNAVAH